MARFGYSTVALFSIMRVLLLHLILFKIVWESNWCYSNPCEGGGRGGARDTPLHKLFRYVPTQRVKFWAENRYRLWPGGLELGIVSLRKYPFLRPKRDLKTGYLSIGVLIQEIMK